LVPVGCGVDADLCMLLHIGYQGVPRRRRADTAACGPHAARQQRPRDFTLPLRELFADD
jgi:hypothetical protein